MSTDIEVRPGRVDGYRARVRWIDPGTRRRKSRSQTCSSADAAGEWIAAMQRLAEAGVERNPAVVTGLGYEHLRRHDFRHTGLTWMADAGVPVHVLRKIAGHGSLVTTQRYLHPDSQSIAAAGAALSAHLTAMTAEWSQSGPKLRLVREPAGQPSTHEDAR